MYLRTSASELLEAVARSQLVEGVYLFLALQQMLSLDHPSLTIFENSEARFLKNVFLVSGRAIESVPFSVPLVSFFASVYAYVVRVL